jgi:methionyl-tRNA formyltransferase
MGYLGFEALRRHGFEVVAVYTHQDSPGEVIWWESLAEQARSLGIPVHYPEDVRDPAVRDEIAAYAPDFIFSFYYRKMIPTSILDLAPRGALNLHGSLLPRVRGRAPVNWALVKGEKETGVSLHYMVAKPDAGDLVDQQAVPIRFEDTAYTLFRKLETAATTLLDRSLPALRDGTAVARPLDLSKGSYFGGRRPEDGRIDWSADAARIYDLVRAVTHPYPGAFTELDGRRLYVWWALPCDGSGVPGTILAVDREGIVVAAGEGAVRLITIQIENEPEMPAASLSTIQPLPTGKRLGT